MVVWLSEGFFYEECALLLHEGDALFEFLGGSLDSGAFWWKFRNHLE